MYIMGCSDRISQEGYRMAVAPHRIRLAWLRQEYARARYRHNVILAAWCKRTEGGEIGASSQEVVDPALAAAASCVWPV